jgi:hypothetical protein
MPAMNATTPAKNNLAWAFLKRSTWSIVLGHVGEGRIVFVEGSDLGDTNAADGVFDLSLKPDLLGALQVARHERDFAAHLTVAANPFEGDEHKPKAIEDEGR